MDLRILSQGFEHLLIIDKYDSFIWTERYYDSGDFEIVFKNVSDMLPLMQVDRYLISDISSVAMVIEKVELKTDLENGDELRVSGRTLDAYILSKRIIWPQIEVRGTIIECITKLLNDNLIKPSDSRRKVDNVKIEVLTENELDKSRLEMQFTGDTLYSAIRDLSDAAGCSFFMELTPDNEMIFKLYIGLDRSYGQNDNPFVVFSHDLENLGNSDYAFDKTEYGNYFLVAGAGQGVERKFTILDTRETGLNRSEVFVNASNISDKYNNEPISDDIYKKMLELKGLERKQEISRLEVLDGEIPGDSVYKYGVDYRVGDIIQIINAYGQPFRARITEHIWSEDIEGIKSYPSFTVIR